MSMPEQIETWMHEAIDYFVQNLSVSVDDSDTHVVVDVSGWGANQDSIEAIAKYLIGVRACAIDAAMSIRANLLGSEEERSEIHRNVFQVVGERGGDLSAESITTERNPWIAEAIWHLCMVVASQEASIHPLGTILAVDILHVNSKDHGLDVSALYLVDGQCGFGFLETKAYASDPNGAIHSAVGFFRAVDGGEQGLRIRQRVQAMRNALPMDIQGLITESFWYNEREYISNPHYDRSVPMNWTNERPSFRDLVPQRTRLVIMPHPIEDFNSFFEAVSNEMRRLVNTL